MSPDHEWFPMPGAMASYAEIVAERDALRAERDRFRGLLEECRNFLRMVEGGDALRLADALKSALDESRGAS